MTLSDPQTRVGCDVQDMRLIHRVFRAVFAEAPALAAGVADGDRRHASAVGRHLLELITSLHHHHQTEDVLLWDTLSERAPACGLHVALMKDQHGQMTGLLAVAERTIPAWVASASPSDREAVRAAMAAIDASLNTHLADEETFILPVASVTMSQGEWDRIGEFARKEAKPSMLFPQLGFMLDALGPDDGERFLRETMPAPVRLLWNSIGKGVYRRYRARLLG